MFIDIANVVVLVIDVAKVIAEVVLLVIDVATVVVEAVGVSCS